MILEQAAVDALRDRLPDYLRETGRWKGRGNLRCLNPAHADHDPSMSYDPKTKRLHCFGCGKSYDLFDVLGLDYPECSTFPAQVKKAGELYGVDCGKAQSGDAVPEAGRAGFSKPAEPRPAGQAAAGNPAEGKPAPHPVQQRPAEAKAPGNRPAKRLAARSVPAEDYTGFVEGCIRRYGAGGFYFAKRGIPYELCEKHRLFEGDGRAYLPVYRDGKCVAYCSRSTDGREPRYRNSAGPMDIFGGDLLRGAGQGDLVVAESIFDALSAEACGVEAVALCGAASTDRFLRACAENPALRERRFLLAGDNDAAGQRMNRALAEGLDALGLRHACVILPEGAKDLNDALRGGREALEAALRCEGTGYSVQSAAAVLEAYRGLGGDSAEQAVSTGLPGLDRLLEGGMHSGLYVLGAISSIGKTSLALQIADGIAESGRDVLYFTLEMSRMELIAKSLSRISWGLDKSHARALTMRQVLAGSGGAALQSAAQRYGAGAGSRLFFFEEAAGAADIRQAAERHVQARGGRPVVMVDYLQILKPADARATDKQNTDRAVVELKRISREFGIPVLAVSSFNRENYRNAVSMEAFKESGAVEYSSDVLLGLQLAGAGEPRFDVNAAKLRTPRNLELVLLKNRAGSPYGVLPLRYFAKFSAFAE